MKVNLLLLQILSISFLLCFFTKASETSILPQKVLLAPSFGKVRGFSLPFEPKYQKGSSGYHQFGFPIQFPTTNNTVPLYINMKSSGIWINNSTQSPLKLNFNCSTSPTCSYQGPVQYHWIENIAHEKKQVSLSGTLIKEQVSFEDGLALSNADILIANELSVHYLRVYFKGVFGLSFKRSTPSVPTFHEYLKAEGLVDKSIFSIYLNTSNHGELIFGGYDPKRAGTEFQYAKWQEYEEAPGFSLPIKRLSYGNITLADSDYIVIIDFDSDSIVVPKWIIDKIGREDYIPGWNGTKRVCDLTPNLQDIVIEFGERTLRIPPTVYTSFADFEIEKSNGEVYTEIGCTSLTEMEENARRPKIVLGRPFLKYFYTVFNLEEKTVGFSIMSDFVEKSPERAEDSSGVNYEKICALLALVFLGVFLYFVRKAQKKVDYSARKVASPVPKKEKEKYSVANVISEESQQEPYDAGEITIEEVI